MNNKIGSDTRPQISSDIDIDKHSTHLSNHELDYINKIHFDESLKHKKKTIFELTLNEIIENTIKFIINFNNELNQHLYDIELELNQQNKHDSNYNENSSLHKLKSYLFAIMLYIGENENLIYFGIILIILSFILYFFNITRDD